MFCFLGSCVRFCCHNILFLRTQCEGINCYRPPLVSALEFRRCWVIPSANQKLTFDERISCITRHDDFSPRSHRAVSLEVSPFLRDRKGNSLSSPSRLNGKRVSLLSSDSSKSPWCGRSKRVNTGHTATSFRKWCIEIPGIRVLLL